MKKILLVLIFTASAHFSAQVAFGKDEVSSSSVSLEFGNGNRGVVVPYVQNLEVVRAGKVPGTIIMDAATGIVSYCKQNNCQNETDWSPLTFNVTNVRLPNGFIDDTTGKVPADIANVQHNKEEHTEAKVIIGEKQDDNAEGILVLSDANKAMVLPSMESPHLKIINPAPGMMAYDLKTNQLAIFNGTVWSFWKPVN
ncbi:hypothetical protein ACF3N7_01915 [Cruoricaptor ignavus]|uniref:hypothetical protein n=1 Tax=Cruoricaptor ignavus TaxID=1118202 RepID=UPI00370DC304